MTNNRILIVDDNKSIHDDFRKVLSSNSPKASHAELDDLEQELFGSSSDKDNSQLAQNMVEYEVDSAFQGEDALNMIKQAEADGRPYAMAFIDVRMPPGWDGVETIYRIWQEHPYVEMVLCTAYSDYTWEEMLSKLGATDKLLFLRKPFDAIAVQQMAMTLVKKWNLGFQARNQMTQLESEVAERTRQLRHLLTEVEEKNVRLAEANKELKHVALHDSLTKLPNRTLFHDRLQHGIKQAEREGRKLAVCLVDLDEFKEINDRNGHLVGDAVLIEVGNRMFATLRKSDTVARLGGDEFALILNNISVDAPDILAWKVQDTMKTPVVVNDISLNVHLSIGIAVFPDHGTDFETLLKHADAAMYFAKRSGLGAKIFNQDEDGKRLEQTRLASDLERDIARKNLLLHYQPIIDLRTGSIHGVEALIRWPHEEKGLIMPDNFIHIAEKKGLIRKLTMWAFETGLHQCFKWHQAGKKLMISINLSPRNLLDPSFPEDLDNILRHSGLGPEWIRLEITENMTISQPERALENLNALKELGLHIAIDDFGTGYSSLTYLKKLPVKELKIDKSFVIDMDKERDNELIVKSTIELAHALGLEVVAEGVEEEKVLNQLKAMGCDLVQGYHFCRPLPREEIENWLFNALPAADVAN